MTEYKCRYCKQQVFLRPADFLPRTRCYMGSTGRGGFHLWKRVS